MFKYKLFRRAAKKAVKKQELGDFVKGYLIGSDARIVQGSRRSHVDMASKSRKASGLTPRRPFPISHPEFIILYSRKGKDVAAIEDYRNLDGRSRDAIESALASNVFSPNVVSIKEIKMTGDGLKWKLVTDRGTMSLLTKYRRDVQALDDKIILIDEFNSPFVIDLKRLDRNSLKLLDRTV